MNTFEQVIEKLRQSDVPHASEIVVGLDDGSIQIDHADLSGRGSCCAELFEIYTFRSRPKPNSSAHSLRLRADTVKLVGGLARYKQERCYILRFSKSPNISYCLFVLTDLTELLGSFMSFDKRKTSAEDWNRIWQPGGAQPNG